MITDFNLFPVYRPIFRSYQPQDETLKELQLPKAKPLEGKRRFCSNFCILRHVFKNSWTNHLPNTVFFKLILNLKYRLEALASRLILGMASWLMVNLVVL